MKFSIVTSIMMYTFIFKYNKFYRMKNKHKVYPYKKDNIRS